MVQFGCRITKARLQTLSQYFLLLLFHGSVGIVRSRTKATEFSLVFSYCFSTATMVTPTPLIATFYVHCLSYTLSKNFSQYTCLKQILLNFFLKAFVVSAICRKCVHFFIFILSCLSRGILIIIFTV